MYTFLGTIIAKSPLLLIISGPSSVALSCCLRAAGFIRLDGIRMLLEKILTFILLFNYSIYIILVLKIHNSIISALKIMNLKILVLNFSKCIIPEYVRINNSFFPVSPHWWLCWLYDCTLRCTLGLCLIYLKHIYFT